MHRGLNHVLDTTLRILPTGIHLDSQLPCAVDTHSPPFYTWEKLTICPQQGDGQVCIGTWWCKFLETNKQGPVPKGGAKPWPGMREWAPEQEDCGRAMYPKGHQVQGCLKLQVEASMERTHPQSQGPRWTEAQRGSPQEAQQPRPAAQRCHGR